MGEVVIDLKSRHHILSLFKNYFTSILRSEVLFLFMLHLVRHDIINSGTMYVLPLLLGILSYRSGATFPIQDHTVHLPECFEKIPRGLLCFLTWVPLSRRLLMNSRPPAACEI